MQKNYYLHQSARDGFRSYLQAYASYSLKKIFDINKLDLAKVGKAFGFTVPPRVNVSVGEGKSSGGGSGDKRKRVDNDDDDGGGDSDADDVPGSRAMKRNKGRDQGKERRKEQLGKKQVEKEVYRKEKITKVDSSGQQWGR